MTVPERGSGSASSAGGEMEREDMSLPEEGAIVVVDKPAGMTSHDVVARLRKTLGTRKVGHSGTLDPDLPAPPIEDGALPPAAPAEQPAGGGHPLVVRRRDLGAARALPHGSQLVDRELATVATDAPLANPTSPPTASAIAAAAGTGVPRATRSAPITPDNASVRSESNATRSGGHRPQTNSTIVTPSMTKVVVIVCNS